MKYSSINIILQKRIRQQYAVQLVSSAAVNLPAWMNK